MKSKRRAAVALAAVASALATSPSAVAETGPPRAPCYEGTYHASQQVLYNASPQGVQAVVLAVIHCKTLP